MDMDAKCFFLDLLPSELRLIIYEQLLVAEEPIRGRTVRKGKKYELELQVLRLNRRIFEEARVVFFGKNTFCITSMPRITTEERDGSIAADSRPLGLLPSLDPPLQHHHLPFVRHLTIDLLYYPLAAGSVSSVNATWQLADPGATEYVSSLITLLHGTPNLQTLHLSATPPPTLDAKRSLVSFYTCDRNRSFAAALASLPRIHTIPLNFEFPDCFYHTVVHPADFMNKSILLLACQVLFCQSQVRIHRMMRDFEEGRVGCEAEGVDAGVDKVDLGPLVSAWPARTPCLKDVVMQARQLVGESEF